MRLCTLVAVLAALVVSPSTAAAAPATARIDDRAGDNGQSFETTPTDVRTVSVVWDDATLRVDLAYQQPPDSDRLSLLIGDVFDEQAGDRCDPSYVPQISVEARGGAARLRVPSIDGVLRTTGSWSADGRAVAYVFSSPALVDRFGGADASDPFTCVSGDADGDGFLGAFDGRMLRLTPERARQALRAHLAKRFGTRFTRARRPWLMCPRVAFFPPNDESGTRANCQYEFRLRRGVYVTGGASFVILGGRPYAVYKSRAAKITKQRRRCRPLSDLELAGARVVDRTLRASALVGCRDNGASMIRDLHYYRGRTVAFHGANRAGFEDQMVFRCRVRRAGSRYVARCRNRRGDGFVYRYRKLPRRA